MPKTPIYENKRWGIKVNEDLFNGVDILAEKLGMKRSKLIKQSMYKIVLCPEIMFKLCPTCKEPTFDPETVPISEGVSEIECCNGHTHEFDFETEEWVN